MWRRSHPAQPARTPGQRGREGEALACAYLVAQGYRIEARNVRFPCGELDLVALDGQALCMVEVRARSPGSLASAAGSITRVKRRRLIQAAQLYLRHRGAPWAGDVRFDVVAIEYGAEGQPSVELIKGAFWADE